MRLWDYDEGICYYNGVGHSGAITKIAIAPNQKFFVSVGSEGSIFMWHMPENVGKAKGEGE